MENLSQIISAISIIFVIVLFFATIEKNRRDSKNELLDELLKDNLIDNETYLKYKNN